MATYTFEIKGESLSSYSIDYENKDEALSHARQVLYSDSSVKKVIVYKIMPGFLGIKKRIKTLTK